MKESSAPLLQSLQQHFGYNDFRPGQREVVEALLEGRDCLAVLPTGAGKSLCYQLPALVRSGVVLVISPLVALMQDQVAQLRRRGIAAACLHNGLPLQELRKLQQQIQQGTLRLLYLAPERLQGEACRQLLEDLHDQRQLVALAVDEAHCISNWGHDFRPDYRRLGQLRRLCPGVPLVCGNVATADGARFMRDIGADAVKVGVGPGRGCRTRLETAAGVPQLQAIRETWCAVLFVQGKKHHRPRGPEGKVEESATDCADLQPSDEDTAAPRGQSVVFCRKGDERRTFHHELYKRCSGLFRTRKEDV